MPTIEESVCCQEVAKVWEKVKEECPGGEASCMTHVPGFSIGCLERVTLEIAYRQYRMENGHYPGNPSR